MSQEPRLQVMVFAETCYVRSAYRVASKCLRYSYSRIEEQIKLVNYHCKFESRFTSLTRFGATHQEAHDVQDVRFDPYL